MISQSDSDVWLTKLGVANITYIGEVEEDIIKSDDSVGFPVVLRTKGSAPVETFAIQTKHLFFL